MTSAVARSDEIESVRAALNVLCADERALWLRIGIASKAGLQDAGFELRDEWSRTSEHYNAADMRRIWRSMKRTGGMTLSTLSFEAKRRGQGAGQLKHPRAVQENLQHKKVQPLPTSTTRPREGRTHCASRPDMAALVGPVQIRFVLRSNCEGMLNMTPPVDPG